MSHTRISEHLFDWPPLAAATLQARWLWLTLYAGSTAKRWLPGLLKTTLANLGEEARLGYLDVQAGLRELVERRLVEHDPKALVVRLRRLPDKGERPANQKVLRMFWNRFVDLPPAPIKRHHVGLVYWLVEPHRTPKIQEVWNETFGTIVPAGVELSTETVYETVSDTVSDTVSPQSDLFSGSYTVPDTVSHTVGSTVYGVRGTVSEEGGAGGGGDRSPPAPAPRPPASPPNLKLTIGDILDTLVEASDGRVSQVAITSPAIGAALWDRAAECEAQGWGLREVRLAGELLAAGHLHYRNDLGAVWVSRPGNLLELIEKAKAWDADGRPAVNGSRAKGAAESDIVARARRLQAEGR